MWSICKVNLRSRQTVFKLHSEHNSGIPDSSMALLSLMLAIFLPNTKISCQGLFKSLPVTSPPNKKWSLDIPKEFMASVICLWLLPVGFRPSFLSTSDTEKLFSTIGTRNSWLYLGRYDIEQMESRWIEHSITRSSVEGIHQYANSPYYYESPRVPIRIWIGPLTMARLFATRLQHRHKRLGVRQVTPAGWFCICHQ